MIYFDVREMRVECNLNSGSIEHFEKEVVNEGKCLSGVALPDKKVLEADALQ